MTCCLAVTVALSFLAGWLSTIRQGLVAIPALPVLQGIQIRGQEAVLRHFEELERPVVPSSGKAATALTLVPLTNLDAIPDIRLIEGCRFALLDGTREHDRRMPDGELGELLGYDRSRDIRKIIERWKVELEDFGDISMRATVARMIIPGKNEVSRTVEEYWLNRDQALYIAMKSDTKRAHEVRVLLIRAYRFLEEKYLQLLGDQQIIRSLEQRILQLEHAALTAATSDELNTKKVIKLVPQDN